jgi:hypothetical protein
MAIELIVVEPVTLGGKTFGVGEVVSDAAMLVEAETLHPNSFRRRNAVDCMPEPQDFVETPSVAAAQAPAAAVSQPLMPPVPVVAPVEEKK